MIKFSVFGVLRCFALLIVVHESCHGVWAVERRSNRIVGGIEAIPGRYPYQVALVDSGNYQYCGGTLVASDWVLSAAHCGDQAYQVHVGRHDLSDQSEEYDAVLVDFEVAHPEYEFISDSLTPSMNFDFLLLHLTKPVSAKYVPVRLDRGDRDLPDGTDVTIMGWGHTCYLGEMSPVLLEAEVDVIDNQACGLSYGEETITDQMVCARRSGTDACMGDSGGPLIVKGEDASADVQVGVISWGKGCADPLYPGVYARMSVGFEWINATMNDETPKFTNWEAIQYKFRKYVKRANRNWKKKDHQI